MTGVLLLFLCAFSHAATIPVNCSNATTVNAALASANSGDTVLCTSSGWSSGTVSIPSGKDLTLDGGGVTMSGGLSIPSSPTSQARITNLTVASTARYSIASGNGYTNRPWRFDHCTFTSGVVAIMGLGSGPGLIDHLTAVNMGNAQQMIEPDFEGADSTFGWTTPHTPGSPNAIYIEDSSFKHPGSIWDAANVTQSQYGARAVYRYNTVDAIQIEYHGGPGTIGGRWWEIYKNTFLNGGSICLRAGSGLVFNNTGPTMTYFVMLEEDPGYPALYQIGRGQNQTLVPAYAWDNPRLPDINAGGNCSAAAANMVQFNRDVYASNGTCSAGGACTSGVGTGTLLPTTCTVGTGFWKTDAGGNWDTSNSTTNDGALYKCTAANTWALYYTPFTYPYPLTAAGFPDPSGSGTPPPPANTFYIRAGATGSSCTDWGANACNQLPATLQRGATYYLARGNYGSYTFDDAVSGAQIITLKSATGADHGTDTGWQSAYAGQALFTQLAFNTGNYVFDGATGGGPGSWESGFGFKVQMPVSGGQSNAVSLDAGASNLTFRHTDFQGRGRSYTGGDTDLFYLLTAYSNLTISSCFLHDTDRTMILSWPSGGSGMTIEYSKFARNGTAEHREAWSAGTDSNVIVRHNLFEDIMGTGFIAIVNSNGTADHWDIYGNAFYWTGNYSDAIINTGVILNRYDAACGGSNVCVRATNWHIYNNVIANIANASFTSAIVAQGPSVNYVVENNIWYNNQTDDTGVSGATTADYNGFYANKAQGNSGPHDVVGATNPFINWQAGNWGLSSAIPGLALAAPYDKDALGTTRGADGVWDRGAYEFVSGAASSACDLNGDSATNVSDVQTCVNQAIGVAACGTGDINKDGSCNVVDVQRDVNAALGGQCVTQ
jgi:hypothetical protein